MAGWWSVVLTALALTSTVLIGNKRTIGWAIASTSQILWVAYAMVTEQWAFIISAVLFGIMNARNYRRWRRDERRVARERVEEVAR